MNLATGEVLDGMYGRRKKGLLDIGRLDPQNPDRIMHGCRRLFGEAGLNYREVRILHGLWGRIDWVDGERRGGWVAKSFRHGRQSVPPVGFKDK